jgi:dolichol-phosphate mannosyltransferase
VKLSQLGKRLSLMGAEHELSDPMSGFFMVRVATFERFAHRLSGIGFKILLDIVLSAGPGLRIGEVPYRFRTARARRKQARCDGGARILRAAGRQAPRQPGECALCALRMVGALGVGVHLLILSALLHVAGMSFATGQAVTTFIVMILNFVLNNSVTYRDRRLRGWRSGAACHLLPGLRIGRGGERLPSPTRRFIAACRGCWRRSSGLLFTAVWNYGVTSMTTWRQERRSSEQRAGGGLRGCGAGRDGNGNGRRACSSLNWIRYLHSLTRCEVPLLPPRAAAY